MDERTLKDDIAWYHGALAGAVNLPQWDQGYVDWLVQEIRGRWESLKTGDRDGVLVSQTAELEADT